MNIRVDTLAGKHMKFTHLSASTSILEIKKMVGQEVGMAASNIKLLYIGKQLECGTLGDNGVIDDALMHVLKNYEDMSSIQRLTKDFEEMQKNAPPLCTAGPKDDDFYVWKAMIIGPKGTPYEGGLFHMEMIFPPEYPFKPPNVKFITKIYHPNIKYEDGTICLDILNHNWQVIYGVSQILLSITGLLGSPNANSPLNSDAGNLYKKDAGKYFKKAAELTKKHASC